MLLFNENKTGKMQNYKNFNTSNVTIQQRHLPIYHRHLKNFNTSNVTIQLLDAEKCVVTEKFQYI